MAVQLVDDIRPHVEAWKRSFEQERAVNMVCLFMWGIPRLAMFFPEGLFGLKGLGGPDCHFHFVTAMTLIERTEMLVACDNRYC